MSDVSQLGGPIDWQVQPGPCVGCGVENYPLSCGGPSICPSCDCTPPEDRPTRACGFQHGDWQLPEEDEVQTDTQRIDGDIAAGVQKIEDAADWLRRIAQDREGRFESAHTAGAKLASEVYRFIEDPDGVGTDALREAYTMFMALDSGNFYVAGAVS